MSNRKKKRHRNKPSGLMALQGHADNSVAPIIPAAQVQDILSLYARVQAGTAQTLRYDTIADAGWAVRLLAYHAPCRIVLEFKPQEITIALLGDNDEQVGWFLITTKQTGIGKRTRKLQEAERIGFAGTKDTQGGKPAQA